MEVNNWGLRFCRRFSLLLCVCALTACGFHLRGQIEMPEQLSPLYLEAENIDSSLLRELDNILRANNINRAESKSDASAFLKITQANKSRRVLSVDNRGRVREYELSLRIQYTLQGRNISRLDKKISLTRDLLFDPDSVLAISHEQEVLYQDMSRDAARLMLQQLQAVDQVDGNNQEKKAGKMDEHIDERRKK
jgi:LPS-assembly lipoprotein